MKKGIFALLLLVAVCVVYAPAVRNGFVWDDTALVLRDPLIRSWRLIPEGFNHFLFTDATASDFYRPLQRLHYTIDYAAFAFHPAPYHIASILWHVGAAIALFIFGLELLYAYNVEQTRRVWVAFLAALVWAVHPVQSAAVVYVSGLADPLAATFGFLGLYLTLRSFRSEKGAKTCFLIGAGAAFLLSVLSKESGFAFPVIAIGLIVLRKNWGDLWKWIIVGAFVSAIYFSLRAGAEHYPPPRIRPPAPVLVRPIIMARAVAEYAGLLVLPWNLHMDRDVETRPSGFGEASMSKAALRELQTLLGILLFALFIYWIVKARRRSPPVFACLIFALISYVPISGIVTLNATVAEHWIYVPSGFFLLAMAIEANDLIVRYEWYRKSPVTLVIMVLFSAWLVFLGARTFTRNFDWKDQRTFVERTIASGGNSARMLVNLGLVEFSEGKTDDAAMHLHAAVEKQPDQPLAVINLANLALRQGDLKLARELLTRATKMPLVEAQAQELLAILEHKQTGRVDLMRMRLAARTGPPNWDIEKRYVELLDEAGAHAAAMKELMHCLQTQWYRAESWELLANILSKQGRMADAADAMVHARAYDVHLGVHSFSP